MSTGWITGETLFPFGGAIAISPDQLVTTDISLQKTYPGIGFVGLEPSSVFQEVREVSGDWWFVSNATFESVATPGEWTQVSASLPSFATVYRADGSVVRLEVHAGVVPPLAWVTLYHLGPDGSLSLTPSYFSSATQHIISAQATWNAPTITMVGYEMDITDTASSAASLLENFRVNGATVWSIDKTGSLVTGGVPLANCTGTFNHAVNINALSFSFYGSGGIAILQGVGAPSLVEANGSLYARSDGTLGARLYVSNGATWAAVAGV